MLEMFPCASIQEVAHKRVHTNASPGGRAWAVATSMVGESAVMQGN